MAGGTFGGPIIKDKLFGFLSYQHIHSSDQEIGLSRITVPAGAHRRSQSPALAALVNGQTSPTAGSPVQLSVFRPDDRCLGTGPGDISPIAYALLNYKLPNGQYLVPSADGQTPSVNFPENAIVPGTALLHRQSGWSRIWTGIVSGKDTVSLKYYYQHDPTIAPYAYSSFAGFDSASRRRQPGLLHQQHADS